MDHKLFVFRFGDVEVQEKELRLTRNGEPLAVEPKAFRLLVYLVRHAGRLIPKEELLSAVWGDTAVTENSLTRAIALLRRLLEDDARNPRFIETVTTAGYRFVCPVAIVGPASVPVEAGEATKVNESASQSLASPGAPNPATASAVVPLAASTRNRKWVLFGAASILLLIVFIFSLWYLRRPLPPPRITAYTQITHDGRDKSMNATDGNRLYFTQHSPNFIAQIGVNGGEIARLPIAVPAVTIDLRDVSPDGSNTLVGNFEAGNSGNSQWVVPVLGGAARRLEDGLGSAFSPDGSSIIYSTRAGDIYTVRTDGTRKQKLASVGSLADGFRWSPDSKSIRFAKDNLLWEMSSDGTGVHRLLPDWKEPGWQCCGHWTPDGKFYLFHVWKLTKGEIWALDERRVLFRPQTPAPIRLTDGPISWWQPIPSKDGKTIFADGGIGRGELCRIDLKTGSPQPFLGGISAEMVAFSPDGSSVAYVAFPEGTLWKANRDGSNRLQLTQPGEYVSNPRWSPDSKEIVFGALSLEGHESIRRISATDGTPLWLMSEESTAMSDPNWSPDGKQVVFTMGHLSGYASPGLDLRIVDLTSRQVRILPGSKDKFSPRWSPDGRYIAALFGGPPQTYLPIFDLTTQQWHTSPVRGNAGYPSFSSDSRFLYFLRTGREQGVFRIPVTGGKEERVLDMANWHLAGSFGFSMSLDPSDAPLVTRDIGTDDIYALTLETK